MNQSLQPPNDPEQFFMWFKATSEHEWIRAAINPHIYGFQIQAGTRWLPGLTESEIACFEAELGCSFPSIYRLFLKHMNGTDKLAVNVYGKSGAPYRYNPAYYSYPRDRAVIKQYIDWIYAEFKVTPETVDQQDIPHIVPITSHRFLIVDRCETHPVLSMHGRDTIIYASSLQTFLIHDIFRNHRREASDVPINMRFWLDDEDNES